MTTAYVTIENDLGMQYSDRKPSGPGSMFLEMTAYDAADKIVGSLSEIEFFEDGKDWVRGTFHYVAQIPEACDHLRNVARDLGLPEGESVNERLEKAIGLLNEALIVLHDLADKAGDVSEWNEGGEYFEVSSSIRNFLRHKE